MNKCQLVLFISLCLSLIGTAQAEIYTWTDGAGVVHFSDRPEPGAKTVHLQESQTYSPPPASGAQQPPSNGVPQGKTSPYESVQIIDPVNEVTIRNPQGFVPVTVEVKPKLAEGDGIQLVLDGRVLGKPQQTSAFTLQNLDRGSHTLVAQVVNEKGTVQSSSKAVTIFMMQPRVNMGPMNRTSPAQ